MICYNWYNYNLVLWFVGFIGVYIKLYINNIKLLKLFFLILFDNIYERKGNIFNFGFMFCDKLINKYI